jgi:ATP-dependent DNA ligase
MLCTGLRDPSRFGDPRYAAEPKLDGQRAQVHIADGGTVAAFSRTESSLLAYPGLAWLRGATWSFRQGVLDGELWGRRAWKGFSACSRPGSHAGRP